MEKGGLRMALVARATGDSRSRKPGRVGRGRAPGMPDSPEAIEQSRRHREGDDQNEPAIRRVVEHMRCLFPLGQSQPEQTKKTSSQEAHERISKGLRNPQSGESSDPKEKPGREKDAHQVNGCRPSSTTSAHSPGAVAQDEQERHCENEREDEEQCDKDRNERHVAILRRNRRACSREDGGGRTETRKKCNRDLSSISAPPRPSLCDCRLCWDSIRSGSWSRLPQTLKSEMSCSAPCVMPCAEPRVTAQELVPGTHGYC